MTVDRVATSVGLFPVISDVLAGGLLHERTYPVILVLARESPRRQSLPVLDRRYSAHGHDQGMA
jgi:hypothetical protein